MSAAATKNKMFNVVQKGTIKKLFKKIQNQKISQDIMDQTSRVTQISLNLYLLRANKEHHYTLKISTRLGRTRYKEQFMFLYRDDLVDLVSSYQFDDEVTEGGDVFARDPYILRFRCLNTVLKDLVMIPVHTKPEDSEKELDELYDVFQNVKKKWRTDNIMILGDFNADDAYVSNHKNFHWLIGDDVDTTASTKNTNTYDRIVVYGDDMLNAVVPNSAKTFNFQEEFKLSEAQVCFDSCFSANKLLLCSLPYLQYHTEYDWPEGVYTQNDKADRFVFCHISQSI
uniref:Endonuclease/exonuclease/phosphatase domain-containing protein n=1 Tax=Oreochromis aureus TaxID=47969 RepID=A0A668S3N5_OREAU